MVKQFDLIIRTKYPSIQNYNDVVIRSYEIASMCAGINWSLLELNLTNTNMKHKETLTWRLLICVMKGTFKCGHIRANVSWVELCV